MTATLIPLLLLVMALMGAPLFCVIAASAAIGFYGAGVDLQVLIIEIYRIAQMPVLVAIPLFTLAGYVLGESGAPGRLVRLTQAILGWMPGGLAIVALSACALFTAFTGASGVTIVALGALLYPALQQGGYSEKFSLGLVTTSGSLGLLFAPSLPLILYAVVVQQLGLTAAIRVEDLFLAGLLPGLLMWFALSLWSVFQARSSHSYSTQAFDLQKLRDALRESAWEIPLPIFVLGGIYGGFFAISEAAAMTAAYVLLVEVAIRRELSIRDLLRVMQDSMILVGAILVILAVSLASTNYVIDADIPYSLFQWVQSHIASRQMFLLALLMFLLALGMLLDIFSALVLMVPIILPVSLEYGVHPVHLGIIFLAAMQIGYLTPPVGMNLFISSFRFEKPLLEVYRSTIPFFLILLLCVVIITWFPELSLVLLPDQP